MQLIKVVLALETLKTQMVVKEVFKIVLKFIKEKESVVKDLIAME
jgi:hypothetical protein